MTRVRPLLSALCVVYASAAAQSVDVRDVSRIPFLEQSGREGYMQFLTASPHRAYAVCVAGTWAHRSRQESPEAAAGAALAAARQNARGLPCVVYAVDDQVVTGATLQRLSPAGFRQVLAGTQLTRDAYADEIRDEGVSPQDTFRQSAWHAPTPNEIPGARIITTGELRQALLGGSRPVLVDARPNPTASIPGSHVNAIIGINFTTAGLRVSEEFLARIAPDKSAPIVFFCVNWECWLSYNAALRALAAGYSNVFWYRGGVGAWFEAGLPLEAK